LDRNSTRALHPSSKEPISKSAVGTARPTTVAVTSSQVQQASAKATFKA
jgi:hypothetical protein